MIKAVGEGKGEETQTTSLHVSGKATQLEIEETLLESLGKTLRFAGIPILGWLERQWVSHSAKNELIEQITDSIEKEDPTLHQFNKVFFAPLLSNRSLRDLISLKEFGFTTKGALHFSHVRKNVSEAQRGKKILDEQIAFVAKAYQKSPEATNWLLENDFLPFMNTKHLPELGLIKESLEGMVSLTNFLNEQPILTQIQELSNEDKSLLFDFMSYPAGLRLLREYAKRLDASPALLETEINDIVEAMKKNPSGLERVLATNDTVLKMMGGRFSDFEKFKYLDSWITAAKEMEPGEFNPFINQFERFLNQAKAIQSERPKVYTFSQKPNLIAAGTELRTLAAPYSFLEDVISEIQDSTVLMGYQVLQEGIKAFYLPRDGALDTIPTLRRQYPDNPLSLSKEFHLDPDKVILEDDESVIDFSANIEFYITNEKTGETRCFSSELPIKAKMSKTEARKRLSLLSALIDGPDTFKKHAKKLGFSIEKTVRLNLEFDRWFQSAQIQLAHLIFDFNETETRRAFSYVKSLEVRGAMQDNSPEAAVKAAKTKNVFVVEGGLSLLPPEVRDEEGIGRLEREELNQAAALFVKTTEEPVALTLPIKEGPVKIKMVEGTLHFKTSEVGIPKTEGKWTELDTIIETEGKLPIVRTTRYNIDIDSEEELERFTQSPIFERDLLLAKAAFMEKYA